MDPKLVPPIVTAHTNGRLRACIAESITDSFDPKTPLSVGFVVGVDGFVHSVGASQPDGGFRPRSDGRHGARPRTRTARAQFPFVCGFGVHRHPISAPTGGVVKISTPFKIETAE